MPRYLTNVALSFKGDRIERGAEIELSAEEAARIDPADITAVSAIPEPEPEAPAVDVPLEEMTLAQLKERAKELGLKATGSAADLRERIALNSGAPETDGNEAEGEIINE